MTDSVWKELETVVLNENKSFLTNLVILLDRPLKDIEYCIALMLKCNFSVSEIAIILNRKKSAISYHRKEMGIAIFKKSVPSDYIDPVIRML